MLCEFKGTLKQARNKYTGLEMRQRQCIAASSRLAVMILCIQLSQIF